MRSYANRDVTVCIPSIPVRAHYLHRCLASWTAQTVLPVAYSIAVDHNREGAGPTRNRAMDGVRTEWIAFCDDDDEVDQGHLGHLLWVAETMDADVVWPWFRVIGGSDPFPMHCGRQWVPAEPHIFPITTLVRREVLLDSGVRFPGPNWSTGCDDFPFWCALAEAGARFWHDPTVTWSWHHDSGNTSGLPTRW